jgi:hypothetical protein
MGYFMLMGTNRYLNKLTNYARGFTDEDDVADFAAALASSGARVEDGSGDLAYGVSLSGTDFDVVTEPSDLADAVVGGTWPATMTTTTTEVVDWTKNSLLVVCGDVSG